MCKNSFKFNLSISIVFVLFDVLFGGLLKYFNAWLVLNVLGAFDMEMRKPTNSNLPSAVVAFYGRVTL